MNFLSLLSVEYKKIKRSKIFLIIFAATVILWLPSIINSGLNFHMEAEGISPEDNFFIQGFMALSWFMFPACMVVITVLLNQTERADNGILKMLSLPAGTIRLSLAKFVVMLSLAAAQILVMTGAYYANAAIVSVIHGYNFILPLYFVAKEAGIIFLAAVPMSAFFWMVSVCIQTPVFSVGIGLAACVPSVLLINTKAWFAYPMSYPFFVVTSEYGKLAANIETAQVELVPWIPVAIAITIICLVVSCLCFGRAVKR